jgi:hypothetical protein
MAGEDKGEIRITLRLPGHLRDKLTSSAAEHARSMNGEIVARLSEADELWERVKEAERLESHWREEATELRADADRLRAELATTKAMHRAELQAKIEKLNEEIDRINLLTHKRIPEGLYERLRKVAERNGRTIEEEVVQALEKAFPPPRPPSELREIAAMIEAMIREKGSPEGEHDLLRLAQSLRDDADEQERDRGQ